MFENTIREIMKALHEAEHPIQALTEVDRDHEPVEEAKRQYDIWLTRQNVRMVDLGMKKRV